MRSARKHILAILRDKLGVSQPEFGKLVGIPAPTVQAVELGKFKLSAENAGKIAQKTGVSLQWLSENDVRIAPYFQDEDGKLNPYTREVFDSIQANKRLKNVAPETRLSIAITLAASLQSILASAGKRGEWELAAFHTWKFLKGLEERFGRDEAGKMALVREIQSKLEASNSSK